MRLMSKITEEDVKHIAKLVKLDVTGQEKELAEMFSQTLDYINVLDELDTTDVKETYQVNGLTNVFQKKDSSINTLTKAEVLQNAKEKNGDLFSTKGVFDR